jgi:nucleoside-diphosphate-sugar epimerase
VPLTLAEDSSLLRPTDESEIRSDISRLRALGYSPEIPIERTVEDALAHWREIPRHDPRLGLDSLER